MKAVNRSWGSVFFVVARLYCTVICYCWNSKVEHYTNTTIQLVIVPQLQNEIIICCLFANTYVWGCWVDLLGLQADLQFAILSQYQAN